MERTHVQGLLRDASGSNFFRINSEMEKARIHTLVGTVRQ
jgi:hypothetical protein